MIRVVIASRLPDIARVLDKVDQLREEHGLPERDANAISVILDELLANCIRHGRAGPGDQEIAVELECADGEIALCVEDGGIPFDPTKVPAPDTRGTLAERRVGGVGIAIVRDQADVFEYERRAGRNRIMVRRRIGGDCAR